MDFRITNWVPFSTNANRTTSWKYHKAQNLAHQQWVLYICIYLTLFNNIGTNYVTWPIFSNRFFWIQMPPNDAKSSPPTKDRPQGMVFPPDFLFQDIQGIDSVDSTLPETNIAFENQMVGSWNCTKLGHCRPALISGYPFVSGRVNSRPNGGYLVVWGLKFKPEILNKNPVLLGKVGHWSLWRSWSV